ncbi:response regulator [Halomonas urumqiensis]|uniref:Response regulatory domain-containing protein n=1 Tax=Halomonas urumqiensis TaxID=1684789 RepID=A0A2N7UCE1_9GAMM|nr:response regulator [Halomonas urumqiensis]PMR78109.1 hypothetical protein C1H70_15135 [Halomonas urumqiensis]PTB03260.1 response regulator [Halomonas urumqiensis]GHE20582.1 hypothetical protein GCM10017767_11030 [Halomonas urumqiensis]
MLPQVQPLPLVALLVQGALLALGLLAYLVHPAATFWVMLALLMASSLNLVVCLLWLQRRQADGQSRAATSDASAMPSRATEVEGVEATADEGLRRRLQGLEGDLALRERRLDRLLAGRDRAREESRLKSDYLALLGRELYPLIERMDELLARDANEVTGSDYQQVVHEFRERLSDVATLLAGISGEQRQPDSATAQEHQAPRVLIVDDGPVNLMLARQVLERQGLEVRTATSGEEALTCLDVESFDMVLMDIYMPGMDGVEASRHWRAREARRFPGRRSILVALTANASDEDRRRFREAGLDDYLAKPYRPHALIECVRHWLPGHFDTPFAPPSDTPLDTPLDTPSDSQKDS